VTVRAAQVYLLYLGYEPGAIDGIMGRFTRSALNEFQEQRGLGLTDGVEDATFEALREAAAGS
jgi:peptidoglycan hydrolase-like protein with peptidoglycan-binding domain